MAQSIETRRQHAFSGWPMLLAWLAMLIFALHAGTHMVDGGDTWIALACGRHFINHGVDTVEPFSTNSHKAGPTEEEIKSWPGWARWITEKVGLKTVKYWHPTGWINQNWLTHIIFYWLTHKSPFADADNFSFNSLVYWKFAIYILAVICVYYTGRVLGVNPALSAVFACFAMFVGRTFLQIRPAGFSNLFVAVFLLVLVLATYQNILYIWLIVPLSVFWCNVHGGYIYAFIMLVPFVALNFLTSFFSKRFVSIGIKGVYHTMAAGFVAFIAVIIFNPFHLTNLTHTFVISVSENAKMWRTVHEWHPAFDWDNPFGDEIPFLVMYIIGWVALLIWASVLMFTSRFVSHCSERETKSSDEYRWPNIDLALIVIAGLTIYMAIRSRRFIPIAAVAACPVIAMFVDGIIRAVSTLHNFHKKNRLVVSSMSRSLEIFFTIVCATVVLTLGIWWSLRFKCVYFDSWPEDTKYNSIFMRMTGSYEKPFYACRFIKDNKLKGKMFNYWTEGGFIAWAQQTDPNTGRIPLQLFIDGRAQAAYDHEAFDRWLEIMFKGPGIMSTKTGRRRISPADYEEIGNWIDRQLRKHDVWVVLIPLSNPIIVNGPFVKGLEHNKTWRLVFVDNRQRLFVDTKTPGGKKLFDGISNGKTIYPDDFSENLTFAHTLLAKGQSARKGLDFAIKAFELNPSQDAILEIMSAKKFPELRPLVYNFCKNYVDDFSKNKDLYIKQHGYSHKVLAARIAANDLYKLAKMQKDAGELVRFYGVKKKEFDNEQKRLTKTKEW